MQCIFVGLELGQQIMYVTPGGIFAERPLMQFSPFSVTSETPIYNNGIKSFCGNSIFVMQELSKLSYRAVIDTHTHFARKAEHIRKWATLYFFQLSLWYLREGQWKWIVLQILEVIKVMFETT